MSEDRLRVLSIDQSDAVELIELLEFVEAWLAQGDPAVAASFAGFVGPGSGAYTLRELRADLITWAARFALAPGELR